MFRNSSSLSHVILMSVCLFFTEGRVNPRPKTGVALCVCKFDDAFREFYFINILIFNFEEDCFDSAF